MENELELKAKFFAQYLGQKVLEPSNGIGGIVLTASWLTDIQDGDCLELKSLRDISDEDAIEVAKITGNYFQGKDHSNSNHEEIKKYWTDNMIAYGLEFVSNYSLNRGHHSYETLLKSFDFLRSKGYALPFMGISVEEMQTKGWLTIRKS